MPYELVCGSCDNLLYRGWEGRVLLENLRKYTISKRPCENCGVKLTIENFTVNVSDSNGKKLERLNNQYEIKNLVVIQ